MFPLPAKGGGIVPTNIIDIIKSHVPDMSHGQCLIADYIINHASTFFFLSIQELAVKAGVSHASVVRFCKMLGYSGFIEFSRDVQQSMQLEISIAKRFDLSTRAADTDNAQSLLHKVLEIEHHSLEALATAVSQPDIDACVDMMEQASAVYILARMSSFPIALHFERTLLKACPKCFLMPEDALGSTAMLKRMDASSLLIAIAYSRFANDTVVLARMAVNRGCRLVSITNSLVSPLVPLSQLKFIVPVSAYSFIDLFAAPFSLVATLALEYARRSQHRTADLLADFDTILSERQLLTK